MSSWTIKAALAAMALAPMAGCEEEKPAPAASAKPAPPPAPEPAPAPAPAVKKPSHPCPEGSKGDGTFDKPCVATGATRIMEVTWNGKIGDKGPTFKIINNSTLEVLFGAVYVYYYDKAGKQLGVGEEGKRKRAFCSGNIFAGAMKAGEKAFLNFSCTKKEAVPEGAHAIEAEMQMVGFTAADGDRADTYWKNEDLTPEDRKKGGVKK